MSQNQQYLKYTMSSLLESYIRKQAGTCHLSWNAEKKRKSVCACVCSSSSTIKQIQFYVWVCVCGGGGLRQGALIKTLCLTTSPHIVHIVS